MDNAYIPRKPQDTPLYELVELNLDTFLKTHPDIPKYVEKEFKEFLKCGVYDYGFALFKCEECFAEKTVPFSCKRRGFCPSCAGRRMNETTSNLLEKLPDVPYRQWVLTLPIALRYWLSRSNKLLAKIHEIFISEVSKYYEKRAEGRLSVNQAKTGSITAIQRFSSDLRLNIHFHSMFVEGGFAKDSRGELTFHRVSPPLNGEISGLLESIAKKIILLLRRLGFLKESEENSEEPLFGDYDKMKIFSAQNFIAFGENEGLAPRKIGHGFGEEGESAIFNSYLCSSVNGFSLHAATSVKQHRFKDLKNLLQYMLRPGIANDRINVLPGGDILYRLKKMFSDGTTHVHFAAQEILERIAALIPIPYLNLIRYNGVFAPASPLRSKIVKTSKEKGTTIPKDWRIEWSELLKRTFDVDVTSCICGGRLRLVAFLKFVVVNEASTHRLQTSPPFT